MSFPLTRYRPHISASFPKVTIRCHSVFCTFSPFLSFHCSSVAIRKLVTIMPSCVYLTSGSAPSLPTRIALLIIFSPFPAGFVKNHTALRFPLPRNADFCRSYTSCRAPATRKLTASKKSQTLLPLDGGGSGGGGLVGVSLRVFSPS